MPATITEVKDPDSITMGLGVLGLAAWPTASPPTLVDVGYIKSLTATYNRELKDFESGGILIKRLAFRDRFSMTSDWAELSISNLSKIIPGTSTSTTHQFGGLRTITRYRLRFEHTRADAKIITVDLFKSIAGGEFSLAFAEEEFITFPTEWAAEADTTKPSGQQYGKFTIAT